MRADEAKILYEQSERENAKRWFQENKDEFFKAIREQSRGRARSLHIGTHHRLNFHGFISYPPLVDKFIKELSDLGYKVKHEVDYDQEYVLVEW